MLLDIIKFVNAKPFDLDMDPFKFILLLFSGGFYDE